MRRDLAPLAAFTPFAPLALVAASAAGAALLALRLGQDAGWDLQNYHWYNPWALLTGRVGRDLQPAMRQTYFNPALDVPFHMLATAWGPRAASAALAGFQGLIVPLLFVLARQVVGTAGRPWGAASAAAWAGCVALAVVGFLSPLGVRELGATPGDNTTAVPVLAALALMVAAVRPAGVGGARRVGGVRVSAGSLALAAGLLAGVAVGLKPTNGPYALALAAGLWLAPGPTARRRLRLTAWLALGGVAGTLAAGGWWAAWMHALFGNPLFPQANHFFRSPWADPSGFTDDDFRARDWLGVAFFPFAANAHFGTSVGGRAFHDLRLPLLFVLALAAAVAGAWRLTTGRRVARRADGRGGARAFVVAFVVVGYVGWLAAFSIDRYALVLEALAPVAAVGLLSLAGLRGRALAAGSVAAALVIGLGYRDAGGARVYWSADLFDVELPPGDYRDALVVIASHEPLGFALPSFGDSARFVRVAGNLYYEGGPDTLGPDGRRTPASRHAGAMGEAIGRAVDGHDGPVYVLFADADVRPDGRGATGDARHFGLAFDEASAPAVRSKVGPSSTVRLAPARRVAGPSVASAGGDGAGSR